MNNRLIKLLFSILICIFNTQNISAKDTLLIMFWNVENYFDPLDDTTTKDDEFTFNGENRWSWKRFKVKRNNIAKTIISIKEKYSQYPAIVGFSEVENKLVLNQLIYETPLAKLDYGIVHRDSPDARGIDVAMIYRRECFHPNGVTTLSVPMNEIGITTRNILYVKGLFAGETDTSHIFINHWPSKLGGETKSLPNRMSASKVMRGAVDSLYSVHEGENIRIIIMGDFNDTPDSKPMISLNTNGLHNLSIDKFLLGQGTIKYRGMWEMIDHFIVSNCYSNSKMYIYSPDFLKIDDNKYLGYKPYRTYQGPIYKGGISDHFPIILLIDIND